MFLSLNLKFKDKYLLPELCLMTGFTEQMLSNINLKKDIAKQTKTNPAERMKNY